MSEERVRLPALAWQLEAGVSAERICPTCHRPFKTEVRDRRVCRRCKQPILRHHKFRFVKSQVEHRNCDDPISYLAAA